MAAFLFQTPQQDLLPSIATPCKHPYSYALKPHSFTLSALHEFPQLCRTVRSHESHATKVTEKMPRREQTHKRNPHDHRTHRDLNSLLPSPMPAIEGAGGGAGKSDGSLMADDKMVDRRGREQQLASRKRGSRKNRDMGLSGFSSLRSRGQGASGKSNKKEGGSMVAKKITEDKVVKKGTKKYKVNRAGFEVRVRLEMCSKAGDVMGAIALYESAVREGVELEQYHYNVLLYLCSSAALGAIHPAKSGTSGSRSISRSHSSSDRVQLRDWHSGMRSGDLVEHGETIMHDGTTESYSQIVGKFDRGMSSGDLGNEIRTSGDRNDDGSPIHVSDDVRDYARAKGFEIYEKMCSEKVPMSEAALTSVARMAMSTGSGDMAFEVVKRMKELGICPRLRSYGPALFTFCNNGDIEKAFEVERHMMESGVAPEEPELEVLLRASVRACRGEGVYYLLHKLRTSVRQVSPSTAELIEAWFKSLTASRVGKRKWDWDMVEQAMENGGGGWHGIGWLGKGKWAVSRAHVDADGFCVCCGEKLVTIDLDPTETENFARSVASIASKRERSSSFQKFQKWLEYYGPFEAVVDAANVGLFGQRRFSLIKVNAVVNGIRQKLPSKKWPLIIVHNRRLIGGKMDEPINVKLTEKWRNADAIYATPTGSNDDWYWLYAAIKCKGLIVTNDEMRDHIFHILGNDFFPKWKERHQVHFGLHDGNFEFHMPPPCSIVIQESKEGHWHIPILAGHEPEMERTWLCVTRANSCTTQESPNPPKEVHPVTMMKTAASGAQSNDQTGLLPDGCEQQCRPVAEPPHEMTPRNPRGSGAPVGSPKPDSIASGIEAAEKLSGCVINFQI